MKKNVLLFKIYKTPLLAVLAFLCCMWSMPLLQAQCPAGQTQVRVELVSGAFDYEHAWVLWDATDGVALACYETSQTGDFFVDVCASLGHDLELHAYDDFGDGWSGQILSVTGIDDGSVNGCPDNIVYVYSTDLNPLFANAGFPMGSIGDGECPVAAVPSDGVKVADFMVGDVMPPQIMCPDVSSMGYIASPATFQAFTPGGTTVSLSDDDVSVALPIGFTFEFYEMNYTEFYISSNGFITFTGGQGSGCCSGQLLPDPNGPNNLIAGYWEDLNPDSGGQPAENVISYETTGVPGDQILKVKYFNVDHFANGNNVTFEIWLYENGNLIEVHCTECSDPPDGFDSGHTIGVENVAGDEATTVLNNESGASFTNTAWQFSPPSPGGPTVISCDESIDPANTGMATATDNNSDLGDITIDFSDVSTQGQGCLQYSYLIIRTWTATDECGNSSTCSQAINVQDLVAPNITCPADITVDCADPTDPGFTGYATASGDNCAADDELTVTFMDVSSQTPTGTGCSNDNYTITRTWTASDPCGNTSQCVQVITVQDTEAPVIICPPEVTIECDEPLVTLPVMGTTTASAPTNSVSWPNSGAGSTGLVGSVPVNISGIPAGAEVTDVNIHIDMDQSWVGDLNLTLESPDGTTVNFVDDLECGDTNSGSQDNISATFDSDAAGFSCGLSSNDVGDPDDCSNDYLAASAVSGTVQPQLGSFDVFDGTSAAGDWILSITDEAEGDGGCLINFTVEVSWTVAGGGMTGIPVAVDNCSAVGSIALDISDVTTQTASGCGQYEYVITRTWRRPPMPVAIPALACKRST